MCGKYILRHIPAFGGLGSPPHVREILRRAIFLHLETRITPACAGNTDNVDSNAGIK